MAHVIRSGAIAGLLASASMAVSPAYGAELAPSAGSSIPITGTSADLLNESGLRVGPGYDKDADITEWRRWGRRGWRRGWRRHRGVRAGDVLAGVAIIGGIAAIASAANNNRRRDRDVVIVERDNLRDREVDDLRRRLDEQQRELEYLRQRGVEVERYRGSSARVPQGGFDEPVPVAPIGIDGAIDACSAAASRDAPVTNVDGVERTGNGWSVRGISQSGEPFTCRITNDGQIEALDYRDGFRSGSNRSPSSAFPQRAEGQLSDQGYASARLAMVQRGDPRQPLVPLSAARQPAYPGGPIPGEVIPEDIDGDFDR
ncbi:MAG: hypothetical protein AAF494_00180 [Pseudomonadota bacterium]